MSHEPTSGEKSKRIEDLLHQRKTAFARWSFGKNWAIYRGAEFSLVGGPDEDEIELDGGVFGSLEEVFDHLDTNMDDGGEEGFAESLNVAWDEWRNSDEAEMVHVGNHRLGERSRAGVEGKSKRS